LVAACDNIADELNCSTSTHFYCDGNTKFIPQSLRFDGIFDCDNFFDECVISEFNVSSQTHVIGNEGLRVLLWIIMLLSLVGNATVIVGKSMELFKSYRKPCDHGYKAGVCIKIMILNLAVADFLMGIYLLIIAVKSVEFSNNYCVVQTNWLLSDQCIFAGVIAVISSQTSVLLMTLITSHKLLLISNPFMALKINEKIVSFATVAMWFFSIVIAIIPIIPSLQGEFVVGIIVNHPFGDNFLTTYELSQLLITSSQLPGQNLKIPDFTNLNIQAFCELFDQNKTVPTYCQNPEQIGRTSVGYYGSDGVCLPR